MDDVILTKKRFEKMVEETVSSMRISYMEAILKVCEDRTIDPADVSKFITPVIKDKLEAEAIELNMMKGGNTLPL
jgi:hypothetical protein